MKRAIRITIMLLMVIIQGKIALAQSPQKISYQAIVRDEKGQLVTDYNVGVRISILQGTETGTTSYAETHRPLTNVNGLMSIEIGTGAVVSGTFSQIDWANGPYFIKTEIDPEGGSNYSIIGISQILSVPYALHAHTADSIKGPVKEVDPQFNAWNKSYKDLIDKPNIQDSIRQNAMMLNGDHFDADQKRILKVAEPAHATDAVNKAYVDRLLAALERKLGISDDTKVTDVDGNEYRVVEIAGQTWMAENLRTTMYNDGTPIPHVRDDLAWSNLTSPGYCWVQNDSVTNFDNKFGALYNWYAVSPTTNGNKNICPVGWHVPTLDEQVSFRIYIDINDLILKIVERGTVNWKIGINPATDELGFTALPAGLRSGNGAFSQNLSANWWSSTNYTAQPTLANPLILEYRNDRFGFPIYGINVQSGLSVRCIRD